MKAKELTRKSPPATHARLQDYVDHIGYLVDTFEDDEPDDTPVGLSGEPIDQDFFSIATDGN